jgi:hypothetical protein
MKMVTLSLLSGMTLMDCFLQSVAAADEQQRSVAKVNYLVIYRPGPA